MKKFTSTLIASVLAVSAIPTIAASTSHPYTHLPDLPYSYVGQYRAIPQN